MTKMDLLRKKEHHYKAQQQQGKGYKIIIHEQKLHNMSHPRSLFS